MTRTTGDVRSATLADIEALLRIETEAFPGDRLERRHFRHAVRSRSMAMSVLSHEGEIAGYVLTEFRLGSRVGRISSLAVSRTAAGLGFGQRLLAEAEAEALDRGRDRIRLEVRADNAPATRLYRGAGYREIGRVEDFYEDGEAAERFEKVLAGAPASSPLTSGA